MSRSGLREQLPERSRPFNGANTAAAFEAACSAQNARLPILRAAGPALVKAIYQSKSELNDDDAWGNILMSHVQVMGQWEGDATSESVEDYDFN